MDVMQIIAQSLAQDRDRLTTSALNFANVTTPGYKRQIPDGVSFEHKMQAIEAGTTAQSGVAHDMAAGPVKQTGRALDLALAVDDAFFTFARERQTLYGRAAPLHIDAQGILVNARGDAVQGQGGDIRLQTSAPVIDAQGNIFENGQFVDRLALVSFEKPERLLARPGGLFEAAGEPASQIDAAGPVVLQRHLEGSNVDTAREMVGVMEVMRHFEALQKSAQISDEMLGRALQKLSEN